MPRWHDLTRRLRSTSDDQLTLTFEELDGLLGGLSESGRRYSAYWANSHQSRPHSRAWLDAGFTARLDQGRGVVVFTRTGAAGAATARQAAGRTRASPAVEEPGGAREADVYLVGCVKRKLGRPAQAREMYVSALFRGRRSFVEATQRPWFILSAKYGLLEPDEVIEPYDRSMDDLPAAERVGLMRAAVHKLEARVGELAGRVIEVHAGAKYVAPLSVALFGKGATLVSRTAHLRMGEPVAWYQAQSSGVPTDDGDTDE